MSGMGIRVFPREKSNFAFRANGVRSAVPKIKKVGKLPIDTLRCGMGLTADSALLRVEFCNSQEVQNYSTNLTVFALRKGPTGLFGGNRDFFTNKEAYWATSIGSNGPFDSNFSGRFDSNFSWKPKKSRKTKKVRGRDRRPLIVFPVFLRDFQNPVWNGSESV